MAAFAAAPDDTGDVEKWGLVERAVAEDPNSARLLDDEQTSRAVAGVRDGYRPQKPGYELFEHEVI